MGVLCPIAGNPIELLAALRSGHSGLSALDLPYANGTLTTLAGTVSAATPAVDTKAARRWDRFSILAMQAAHDAVHDANLQGGMPKAAGVFFGSGFGGLATLMAQTDVLQARGPNRISPFLVPALIANAAAGHIAERFAVRGPALTYTSACASGANAIGEAYLRIRHGELVAAIAGGSEAPLHALAVAGFENLRALAPVDVGCLPFSARRQGFCMGEGAGCMVLEELDHALRRHATIYAEITGYATASDAHHIVEPDPEGKGAERAIRRALHAANLKPEHIDYVNAHATGTPIGDRVEADVLRRVFYDRQPWVSSSKGQLGHLLGAAGAVEAVIVALAIQSGILPANVPVANDDSDCNLRLVDQPGRQAAIRHALSNSFGFGGVNAALVFSQADLNVDRW